MSRGALSCLFVTLAPVARAARPGRNKAHHIARALTGRLTLALLATLPLSACVAASVATPMLQKVLVDRAAAQFVGDTCPSLGFDTARAKATVQSVYDRLISMGAEPGMVESEVATFETDEMDTALAERLEAGGVDPENPDPANVCAFGEREKAAGSLLGEFLF